jgi:hypothetical protein
MITEEKVMSLAVKDTEGVELRVGMQVKYGEEKGKITHISEPDGDVNEFGRQVAVYPRVTVKFDHADFEDFGTQPHNLRYPGDYDHWECEDILAADCPACGGSGVRCCEMGADR